MLHQGTWESIPKDASCVGALLQIPHFTRGTVEACAKAGVEGVYDLLEMEPKSRERLVLGNSLEMAAVEAAGGDLSATASRVMSDVARWCARYPAIDVSFDVDGEVEHVKKEAGDTDDDKEEEEEEEEEEEDEDEAARAARERLRTHRRLVLPGASVSVKVTMRRDADASRDLPPAPVSDRFPCHAKELESFWVLVGCKQTGALLGIKKVNTLATEPLAVTVKCSVPEDTTAGRQKWTLFVMNDTFLGVDQEFNFTMDVEPAEMS